MDYPIIDLIDGAMGSNMQAWGLKQGTDDVYVGRVIYWVKEKDLNGWKRISKWDWDVKVTGDFIIGSGADKDEVWGKQNEKRKIGGHIKLGKDFKMAFVVSADFSYAGSVFRLSWKKNVLGIDNWKTGAIKETATTFWNFDNDDIDDGDEKEEDVDNGIVYQTTTLWEFLKDKVSEWVSAGNHWMIVAGVIFILGIIIGALLPLG